MYAVVRASCFVCFYHSVGGTFPVRLQELGGQPGNGDVEYDSTQTNTLSIHTNKKRHLHKKQKTRDATGKTTKKRDAIYTKTKNTRRHFRHKQRGDTICKTKKRDATLSPNITIFRTYLPPRTRPNSCYVF